MPRSTPTRRRARFLGLAIAGLVVVCLGAPAAAQTPGARRNVIAVWEPMYTGAPALSSQDARLSLAAAEGGRRLWLAGDAWVIPYADGVWSPYERPPGAQMIFALAADGADVWAFGLDGGSWLRRAGAWSRLAAPMAADMYAAAVRAPGDVWAAGFDYARAQGVLFHAFGREGRIEVEAVAEPGWKYRSLYAIAVDPAGWLWVGGCDYETRPGQKTPFLMRQAPGEAWRVEPAPIQDGCIYGLSFNAAGFGLAATGGDLLYRAAPVLDDGLAQAPGSWSAFQQSPPEGFQWMRVAAVDIDVDGDANGPAGFGPDGGGWAVAGVPEWNGYRDGQPVWRLGGEGWAPADVDAAAAVDVESANQTLAALAADRRQAWALADLRGADSIEGQARVLGLDPDGRVQLVHPLLPPVGRVREGDIAAGRAGDVWIGASQGAAPFLRFDGQRWLPSADLLSGVDARVGVGRIDLAADGSGWAVGSVRLRSGTEAAKRAAWRFDGQAWESAPVPAARALLQLRALPGGRAWSVAARGQVMQFDGSAWSAPPDAPAVPAPVATAEAGTIANHVSVRAPLDAAGANGSIGGWAGAADGRLFRFADGAWAPGNFAIGGQILDVQLAGPRTGWAIAADPGRSARAGALTTGILLRLQDGSWREVPPRLPGVRQGARATETPAAGGVDVQWHLMAPVGTDEVWLYGSRTSEQVPARQPARVLAVHSRGRNDWAYFGCNGIVQAMAAVPVADAAGEPSGTDIWLLGEGSCASPGDPRLAPRSANGTPNPDYLSSLVGPVSRVRVRRVVDVAYLPVVGDG